MTTSEAMGTYLAYRKAVDAAMLNLWGIDWADACGDPEPLERAIRNRETPEEFAREWGEKYDLDPVESYR